MADLKSTSDSRMVNVFISGIDGSGKTTLAKKLVKKLRGSGIDTEYMWWRWTAFFSYPLLALCRVLRYTEKREKAVVRKYYLNEAIAFLWSVLYPLDYLFCIFFKIQIAKRKNSVIVIDRFIPDVIADVTVQSGIDVRRTLVGRLLISYLNKERFKGIIMDIDIETSIERKDDIPSSSYVEDRQPIYRDLAKKMNWKTIDGSKELKENIRKVMEYLKDEK